MRLDQNMRGAERPLNYGPYSSHRVHSWCQRGMMVATVRSAPTSSCKRSQSPSPDDRPALDEALVRRAVERAASRTYGGTWVAKTPKRLRSRAK